MYFVHNKPFSSHHVSLPLIILSCPLRVYVCQVSYEHGRSLYVFMISTLMPYLQDSISQYASPVSGSYISFVP